MGYTRHHAIIVTTWNDARMELAHQEAIRIFGSEQVTPILSQTTNGYRTFLVGPDGSNEGWVESDEGDGAREAFILWLNQQRHEDDSSPFSFAEIQYGDSNLENTILQHDGLRWGGPYRETKDASEG